MAATMVQTSKYADVIIHDVHGCFVYISKGANMLILFDTILFTLNSCIWLAGFFKLAFSLIPLLKWSFNNTVNFWKRGSTKTCVSTCQPSEKRKAIRKRNEYHRDKSAKVICRQRRVSISKSSRNVKFSMKLGNLTPNFYSSQILITHCL